jgi:hypothetical protein
MMEPWRPNTATHEGILALLLAGWKILNSERRSIYSIQSIQLVTACLGCPGTYEEAQGVVIHRISLAPGVELSPESRSNEFPL